MVNHEEEVEEEEEEGSGLLILNLYNTLFFLNIPFSMVITSLPASLFLNEFRMGSSCQLLIFRCFFTIIVYDDASNGTNSSL